MKASFVYKIALALCAATLSLAAQAQRQQATVYAGGGLSTLLANPAEGASSLGFGGHIGLGYTLFFTDSWGISLGLDAALLTGSISLGSFTDTYGAVAYTNDATGQPKSYPFELTGTLHGYSEKQRVLMLGIPLTATYQLPLPSARLSHFYAALGGRIGLPLLAKHHSSADRLVTTGYFPHANLTLDQPRSQGFGTYNGLSSSGSFDLRLAVSLTAEVGVRWRLPGNMALNTGLYADYGLNDISKPSAREHLVAYNPAAPAGYRLSSALAAYKDGKPLAGKLAPLSAGIRVALCFGFGSKKSATSTPNSGFAPSDEQVADSIEASVEADGDAIDDSVADSEADTAGWFPVSDDDLPYDSLADARIDSAIDAQVDTAIDAPADTAIGAPAAPPVATGSSKPSAKPKPAPAPDEEGELQAPIGHYAKNMGLPAYGRERARLNELVAYLKANPTKRVILTGHTSNEGSHAYNYTVGQQRANLIKSYLVEHGISPERISARTKGETHPLVPNTSEENCARNRRVSVRIVDK